MGKGLIINEDIWTLIEEFEPDECRELLDRLAAFHRGEEVPPMSRFIKGAYQRIVLDNERFDPVKRAELSAKRAEAGKRGADAKWNAMANDGKTWQTMANDGKNGKLPQDKIRKEEIRIDKSRIEQKAAEPQQKCPLFEHEEVVTAWREWVEMRRKTKKPITTERTRTMAINKLMELSKGDAGEAVKVLNQSTDHCWVGLFAVKDEWQRPKPQPTAYAPKDSRKIDYDAVIRDMYVNDLKGE